jgi:exonuclease VII small subunit
MSTSNVNSFSSTNPVPPGTVMSLNIPWTELDQSEDFIGRTVGALGWGWVSCVQLVRKEGKRSHNMAYVHFSHWESTDDAQRALGALESGLELKVFYRGNWYWKIRKSRFEYRAPVAPSAPTWSVSGEVSAEEATEALEKVDHEYEGELSELEACLRVAEAEKATEALEEAIGAYVEGEGELSELEACLSSARDAVDKFAEGSELGKTMMTSALKDTADRVLLGGNGKRLRVTFSDSA